MSDQIIVLSDRIKELSHSIGTGSLRLDGAATGFSAFGDFYASGDALYYAVTDGTDYEVGSGQYLPDGSSNSLVRFPFRSTNSNNAVDFAAGVKEVYVTYPGQYAVFTASGLGDFKEPKPSGLAFWGSSQILCHDDALVWSPSGNKLGITQPDPQHALDIGGTVAYSQIQASGFLDGGSGVLFSGGQTTLGGTVASGGRQLEPFIRNELDATTGSNAVFALSGLVDQRVTLLKQEKGTIFSGPASGCVGVGCSPDYPTFRYLSLDDIPELGSLYVSQDTNMGIDASTIPAGSVSLYKESGVITYDPKLVFLKTHNRLGVNIDDPRTTLDVNGAASVSGDILVSGDSVLTRDLVVGRNATISGNLDVRGDLTYVDSSTVTIWDKNLELASMSGTALYNDANVDDAGIVVKSTDTDKKWTWRDSTDAWTTDQKIHVSGLTLPGNIFQIGDSAATSGDIHTKYLLSVSGVSGVSTEFITDIASNSGLLLINPSGLSGVMQYQIDNATAYAGWSLTDGTVANDLIGGAQTVIISGASGVGTHYDASSNQLVLNASGLSGVLQPQVTANLNAVNASGDSLLTEIRANSSSGVVISGIANTNSIAINTSGTYWLGEIRANSASGNFNLGEIRANSASGNFNLGEIRTNSASGNFNLGEIRTNSASGNFNLTEIRVNSASGNFNLGEIRVNSASGAAISGYSEAYTDAAVLSAGSYTHWTFTDGTVAGDNITNAQTFTVSGASGVGTHYDASSNLLELNASGLSGVLRYDIDNGVTYAGWKLTDGWVADDVIAGGQTVTISGASGIGTHYDASTNMLTLNASGLSGVLKHGIDNTATYAGWNITDGWVADDLIVDGQTVTLSGASGVGTHYDASTNMLTLNASGLSGVLQYGIDNTTSYAGWKVTDGWVADDLIAGGQTVTISGVSGVGTHYDASTNMLVLNPSGLSGVLEHRDDTISGVLEHRDDTISGVLQHGISNLPVGGTAGSGLIKVDQVMNMDIHGSGQLTHLIFNDDLVRIGTLAGHLATGCDNTNMIGYRAGHEASGCDYTNMIGYSAGQEASSGTSANMIGNRAGDLSTVCDYTNMIGSTAGSLSSGCDYTNMIGYQAGYLTTGCDYTNMIGYSAGSAATDCDLTNMIGYLAGSYADDCEKTNLIGQSAGYEASGCDFSNMIGESAGYRSWECDYVNMIGQYAGRGAKGCDHTIMIGSDAGYDAVSCEYGTMLNYRAGYQASGCDKLISIGYESARGAFLAGHNVALGRSTGSGMHHVDHTNMMGYQAGINSSGNYSTTFIGRNAGKESANATTGVYLGESAGAHGSGVNYSVGIGLNAFAHGTGIQSSVALGHAAGTYSEDIKLSEMIGRHAGQSASGTDYGTMIGYEAGASSTGCNNTIMIGTQAGYHSDRLENSIFLGYRAGWGGQVNTNNHLIINPSNRIDPGHWVGAISQHGIIDIADIIHGVSNGSSSKVLNIGKTPVGLVDAVGKTLSIRPAASTDIVLKTYKQSSQSADQIQSSITADGFANTIVNRQGWLQLPVAKRVDGSAGSRQAWTDASSTDQKYKIDKDEGVVALYEDGSDWRLIVTNGSTWFKTDALTEM